MEYKADQGNCAIIKQLQRQYLGDQFHKQGVFPGGGKAV